MISQEIRNLIGLRGDGRKKDEQRTIEAKIGVNATANGSSHFKLGITEIICTVYGPKQVDNQCLLFLNCQAIRDSDSLLNVEYTVAAFAGIDRRTVSKADK